MKGVVHYRWKKGFQPTCLHFYWVARRTDLETFRWLLLMLPVLKAEQLKHNSYYGGDQEKQAQLQAKLQSLEQELTDLSASAAVPPPGASADANESPSDAPLMDGWVELTTEAGHTYYWCANPNPNPNPNLNPNPNPNPNHGGGAHLLLVR